MVGSARRAQRHRPLVEDLVAVLGSDERRCLTNGDVKHEHAFVGPPVRLFDWADGSVTHPLVPVFNLGRQLSPGSEAAQLLASSWHAELDGRAARAGSIVARLLGADVWMRVPPAAWERHPGGIERWVERLADALVENPDFR